MIRFTDALTLALTKLRTHKIRITITIIISSLLFGLLIAILLISEGGFQSLGNFSKEGYGNRFIVNAQPISRDISKVFDDTSVIARAKTIFKDNIAAKKLAAKNLGITYDESSEMQPTMSYSGDVNEVSLSWSAPSAVQAINEYFSTKPSNDLEALKQTSSKYSPTNLYTTTQKTPKSGAILFMKDGKENFTPDQEAAYKSNNYASLEVQLLTGAGLTVASPGLTNPFMLSKDKIKSSNPDAIPVIITSYAAEEILGLPSLENATPTEQLNRVKEIQSKAGSISFSICYRNSTSQQQINEAISVAKDIEKNKNNKDYQKPSLIYQLPAENSCAAAVVKSDTRSSEQKSYDAKLKTFNKQFNIEDTPDQQKIELTVVGIMPNLQSSSSRSLASSGILQAIVGSSSSYGIMVPSDLYEALPSVQRYEEIFAKTSGFMSPTNDVFYAEFKSAKTASSFITEQTCNDSETCEKDGKQFYLSPYGSNSIALDSAKSQFLTIFGIAIIVVIAIASVIMSGTLGRMVSDSRRETAVFRAIGFKRIDITSIYVTYILILSSLVAISSLIIGISAALIFDQIFWQDFTVQSLLIFGASDLTRQFHFFAINYLVMSWIIAAILGSGLISTILPLARNIRRNPIKDMRDE